MTEFQLEDSMRKLVLYMFTTADGFIAGPQGEFDSYEPSEPEHQMANDLFRGADAFMFGRVCYEGFVEYWDSVDHASAATPRIEAEFAAAFQEKPLIVVSRTLRQTVTRATLIADSVTAHVTELKRQGEGYILLVCGPELLGTLMADGLVDEFRLLTKPKIQGCGLALFRDVPRPQSLSLVGTREFPSGTVLHHYAKA